MKMNLAVFFGCASVEHEISVISAVQAMGSMDTEKYNIIPVYVSKKREMYTGDALKDIDEFKNLTELLKKCVQVTFLNTPEGVKMLPEKRGCFKLKNAVGIDFAFPIVHGTNCEDGTIEGFIETLGIPYAECNVISSAVGMDKILFKDICRSQGFPVIDGFGFTAREFSENRNNVLDRIESKLGYPVIIKPANLGSSIGISKVSDRTALEEKITLACSFAPRILAEKAIVNLREINCSVLGDGSSCKASACEEPVMNDEILSFSDKYESNSSSKGMASLSRIIPAKIPDEKTKEIQDISERLFKYLDCCGVVRIDFIIDEGDGGKVYINEINTIPGSLAFYLWKESGIEYKELLDKMISLGQKRDRDRKNLTFTYDTNILEKGAFGAKGAKK
mgnify:CR=1 FL=1